MKKINDGSILNLLEMSEDDKVLDWCVFCDASDRCDSCDASDWDGEDCGNCDFGRECAHIG